MSDKEKPSWFLFQSYLNCFQQDLLLAYLSASVAMQTPLLYFTAPPYPPPVHLPALLQSCSQNISFHSYLSLWSYPQDLNLVSSFCTDTVLPVSFVLPLQYSLFTKLFTAEQFIAVTQASVHIKRLIHHHICINYLKSTKIRYILALVGII